MMMLADKDMSLTENKTQQVKNLQRLYYIVSNLLRSSSPEIVQFYYMNKNFFKKHYDNYSTF
jgi:hypothetical protein